jgi:glycosyltransferase involved in cell wall biosynthesis
MLASDAASEVHACDACPDRNDPHVKRIPAVIGHLGVAVVIPCHNYARFLGECIQSLKESTVAPSQIIVVDDASTDDPESVCRQFEDVQYIRCEVRDVHEARSIGFQHVVSRYVCFLDADDQIPPGYLEDAIEIFKTDRNVAITYPVLQYFGAAIGPAHGTETAKPLLRSDDLEQRNWVSAGSVYRAELVHQSLVFRRGKTDPEKCWSQDWQMAKAVLRSGHSWIAKQMSEPLFYRKHGSNMSDRPNHSYWDDADLVNETVTVATAFSGRWDCWAKLREWLQSQTWPVNKLRLLIINGTHAPLTARMLGLEDWQGSIQIERVDAGFPGLADKERRNAPNTGKAVEAAVGTLYNFAIRALQTEFVVFIEDDVIPRSENTIELLMRQMGPWVSGVSGVYRQRYQTDKCCSFSLPYTGNESFKSLFGEGIEETDGSGFGCLLTRRSLLRRFPLAGDGDVMFFDVEFSHNCKHADNGWWTWLLHRGVQCDHLLIPDADRPLS